MNITWFSELLAMDDWISLTKKDAGSRAMQHHLQIFEICWYLERKRRFSIKSKANAFQCVYNNVKLKFWVITEVFMFISWMLVLFLENYYDFIVNIWMIDYIFFLSNTLELH